MCLANDCFPAKPKRHDEFDHFTVDNWDSFVPIIFFMNCQDVITIKLTES